MSNATAYELYFFGVSILAGIASAVIFDFFRALRKVGNGEKVYVEDILFWLCEAAVVFYVLYNFNCGGVRFYFFIGAAAGIIIYFFTISRFVVKIFTLFTCAIKTINRKLFLFIQKFFRVIFSPFSIFFKKIESILKKTHLKSKKIKKQLKMY